MQVCKVLHLPQSNFSLLTTYLFLLPRSGGIVCGQPHAIKMKHSASVSTAIACN